MAGRSDTDNEVLASEDEEEMKQFRKDATKVITFRIVHGKEDLTGPMLKSNSFNPDMAHQIFDENEMIFGYKQISIHLYYLHNSAKCFLDIKTSGLLPNTDGCKPDNVKELLSPWLPQNHTEKMKDFEAEIQKEKHEAMFGEVIDTFEGERGRTYKVTHCDPKDPEFKEFHQRFETFLVWFIDGANTIDMEDGRWMIFYLYEEHTDEATNSKTRSPVALCTVYKFYAYPNHLRPRISQFFVLPTHQRKGLAKNLYNSVFKYLKSLPNVVDITVEEPTPLFQKIRDLCDCLLICKDLEENGVSFSTCHRKEIASRCNKQKICKKQSSRVFDILQCLAAHKNGHKDYVRFTETIRERITAKIERENRGSKRVCNLERSGIYTEPIDKKAAIDTEYNAYIDSLEWPVNRLSNNL